MKPAKRITDRAFVYVPSVATNIALTFKRVRKEQAAEQAAAALALQNVATLPLRKLGGKP